MRAKTFKAKDGKIVTIRNLNHNDLKRVEDFIGFVNSVIRERDYIA